MKGMGQSVGGQVTSELGQLGSDIKNQIKGNNEKVIANDTDNGSQVSEASQGAQSVVQERGGMKGGGQQKQRAGDGGFKASFKQQLGTLMGQDPKVQQRLVEVRRNLEQEMKGVRGQKEKVEEHEKQVEEEQVMQQKAWEEEKKKREAQKKSRLKAELTMGEGEKVGAGGY